MTTKMTLAAGALALATALTLAGQAAAQDTQSATQETRPDGYVLRAAPPPSNPKDVFRRTMKVPKSPAAQSTMPCMAPAKTECCKSDCCNPKP